MSKTLIKHIIISLTLALLAVAGTAVGQNAGGEFVIKWNDTTFVDPLNHHGEFSGITYHFLAHVGSRTSYSLQDVTTFDPATCIWISDNHFTSGGANKNYYFYDDTNAPRFLCAPNFVAGGALTLSTEMPPLYQLDIPEYKYYFYRWDNGLGRGVQYIGDCATDPTACAECGHVWGQGECWDVFWVAYHAGNNQWKLSSKHYNLNETYLPTGEARGGRYSQVTTTVHAADTVKVGENSGLQPFAGFELEYNQSHQVNPTIYPYSYNSTEAYTTYVYDGIAHHFYGNPATDHESAPTAQPNGTNPENPNNPVSYAWKITGDGFSYLSIDDATSATPTITYSTVNNDVHKTATLTLTVTYADGAKQKASATILVKTPCHNPAVSSTAEVTWVGATVSWTPTAESYLVSWQETSPTAASTWSSHEVGNVTSYTITGLDYQATYQYKVQAICGTSTSDPAEPYPTFTTLAEPGLMVGGAIFGGGRMADVGTESAGGNTEIVVINCDSIGGIYGGNDIAGVVHGADGSKITLGVNSGDANGYDADYGTTPANVNLKFGSVYGGGNGYYAYNGSSFVAASSSYNAETIEVGASVKAMTQTNQVGDVVWTNSGTNPKTLSFPSIKKTSITVTDNYVTADSIFGGAKNAFLTSNSGDGSLITINGGTILAVFGGNNIGGGQGYGQHHIVVNKTTTNLVPDIANTDTEGYGRTFGIRQLYGGGNKVVGSTTNIEINGGQLDEVFAGGNAADIYYANVTLNCTMGAVAQDGITYGNTYSNAIATYANNVITPLADYGWNGHGIYNVRTLFGGNNKATMTRVPNIYLEEGSVGTVYGGGNEGNMDGLATGHIDTKDFRYGTHVVLNSNKMIVDYLYGGCRMSSVTNSTWVELRKGHVGYVYGGCNISGDVGSTRVNPDITGYPTSLEEQEVKGATYVKAGGNTGDNIIVWKNLFAGSNGYYDCSSDGIHYDSDNLFDDPDGIYGNLEIEIPTHNETNVFVSDGATIKGDVYAGGNLAPVGFDDDKGSSRGFPELVGLASVYMDGGTVEQNVYGGGNMADIYGINVVSVSGGTIGVALYGGNDHAGQVAEKTQRILPPEYYTASDGYTLLHGQGSLDVKTYVGVSGDAHIGTVYGGGNGDYTYGGQGGVPYCGTSPKLPIQSRTFVDVHIDGGANNHTPGNIGTVYGGGNGVTVRHGVTVFLNVQHPDYANDNLHVGTIFGGNNKGNLDIVPDIRLVHGLVGTVYGGCNQGAMEASATGQDEQGNTVSHLVNVGGYPNIGSYVRLLDKYVVGSHEETVDAQVTEAVYGGCRMNGVTNNSLVLVEGGDFSNTLLFGGSDISGTVSGDSRVAVTGGTVGQVYGGGNGNYTYTGIENTNTYSVSDGNTTIATGVSGAPICAQSGADILGGYVGTAALLNDGTVAQVFGAGYGKDTKTTGNVIVNVGRIDAANAAATPNIYGDIYGGSAFGNVNTADASGTVSHSTTVNLFNGTFHAKTVQVNGFDVHYGGNVYGGGLGRKADQANNITAIEAKEYGEVHVNVSSADQDPDDCYLNLREANIFGCNNDNGSPQDDVEVHVWRTADTIGDYNSQTGTLYAIRQVFGGGNQADYAPVNSTNKTLVYVHNCRNTIRRVFSGGNAAAASKVEANVEGGRFDYIFGGGNGEVSAANIGAGGTHLTLSAGIVNHLFGGSNQTGAITGPVYTDINGDNMGEACAEQIDEFFGGSNEALLEANVYTLIECGSGLVGDMYGGSNKANITGNVTLDVRGGSFTNVYGGSKGVIVVDNPETQEDESATGAANINGNVTLNLEGGTIVTAYGGSNQNGNITGNITVNVIDFEECPLNITNVFGGGNHADYRPTTPTITSPIVNVMHIKDAQGIKGNVFGGGNEAEVRAHPRVNIGYNADAMQLPADLPNTITPANFHTFVSGNVYGGGNAAGVTGNTNIYVYSGQVCQSIPEGAQSVGIYGGCNTSGTVTGSVHIRLLSGTVGNTTTRANIHGGGFGENTHVGGNVTVDFGEITFDDSGENPVETHNENLWLYGDLYGGSALGTVNTNNSQTTEVNILNGTITGIGNTGIAQYGNVFGGGLGRKDSNGAPAVAALVKGVVQVNIGKDTQQIHNDVTNFRGMANLMKCNVFGCNNQNGTPLGNVYVDVYKTSHPETNTSYAISATYGGGNKSDYNPDLTNNPNSKTHVYVHSCDNTITYVYGAGEASSAYGVETLIEGGRFREIYGGGNGLDAPANIGLGGIGINVNSGHVTYILEGSNHNGNSAGGINLPTPPAFPPAGQYIECEGELVVDAYYFGDNEAEHYGDLVGEITCEQADNFNYKYVYAGSRWAIVYGDIKLTVKGGNIQYLYGGSQGDLYYNLKGDVRRFPSKDEIDDDMELSEENRKYSNELKEYMGYPDNFKSELVGKGGNIVLTVQGGTIGDIIGGCDELGNVEGKITVIIDEIGGTCPLVIGNIYGASNQTGYYPINDVTHHAYFVPGTTGVSVVPSPQVKILKGTVGSDSPVTFNVSHETLPMEGNVFGGGNVGNIKANPMVIVGESTNTNTVEVKGDVFGGGNLGDVNGSPGVIVIPTTHTLTLTQPEQAGCVFRVTDRQGQTISNNASIDEYQDLNLLAIPSAYGFKFDHWDVTNGSVLFENASSTLFTMGTGDATLKAVFTTAEQHTLTLTTPEHGSVAITDAQDQELTDYSIGEGAVLNLVATPATGYAFIRWELTEGSDSSVGNVNAATTSFTMGTANTTLTAVFAQTHTFSFSAGDHGSVSVTDIHGQTVTSGAAIGAGATLYIVGTPDEGYIFDEWTFESGTGTIVDVNAASTTFTMGNVDVVLKGKFKLESEE